MDWHRPRASTTGGPSSSREMIILRNNSHSGIIRVCMGIFRAALRNKIIRQILKKITSPYFYSVTLVIWPLTLMKRTHFSEFSISTFSTFIRKAQDWTLHFRTEPRRGPYRQVPSINCFRTTGPHNRHRQGKHNIDGKITSQRNVHLWYVIKLRLVGHLNRKTIFFY